MSFKRSVQRDRKETITHQKVDEKSEFKKNFTMTWVPLKIESFLIFVVVFILSQFLLVPLLTKVLSYQISLVLVHGLFSSTCVVIAFWLLNKDHLSWKGFLYRFGFCALMFGGFAFAVGLL